MVVPAGSQDLQQVVMLDADTLGMVDLDVRALQTSLPQWQQYGSTQPEQCLERLQQADVVISNKVRLDAALLSQLPRLKLICVAATGTNNVDVDFAKARGITVCNARNYATESVAQHTLALLLMLATNAHRYALDVRQGLWGAQPHFCLLHHPIISLQGKTLGILGYGDSGRRVAQLATALGMGVLVAQMPSRPQQTGRIGLPELLPQCDVISLHCPLTTETENIVNADFISRMKRGSWLVNVARGALVDQQALLNALDNGHLAGAAVDVWRTEPPVDLPTGTADAYPSLIVTPHVAWASRAARQNLIGQLTENIIAFRCGRPIRMVV